VIGEEEDAGEEEEEEEDESFFATTKHASVCKLTRRNPNAVARH